MIDADAERLGDAVGGDVVMGRPDPAGGKRHRCNGGAAASSARDDLGLLVGDDPGPP